MSSKLNELRRNNASGLSCLRLNLRKGVLVIDVSWYDERRRGTSFPVGQRPLAAVARAIEKREHETGVSYGFSPRAAWHRLRTNQKELVDAHA